MEKTNKLTKEQIDATIGEYDVQMLVLPGVQPIFSGGQYQTRGFSPDQAANYLGGYVAVVKGPDGLQIRSTGRIAIFRPDNGERNICTPDREEYRVIMADPTKKGSWLSDLLGKVLATKGVFTSAEPTGLDAGQPGAAVCYLEGRFQETGAVPLGEGTPLPQPRRTRQFNQFNGRRMLRFS